MVNEIKPIKQRYAPALCVVLILCFLVLPTGLACAAPFDQGRLFVATNDHGAKLYLFATMHSEDKRVTALPEAVNIRFEEAKSMAMEIALTADVQAAALSMMTLPAGAVLAEVLPPELYQRLRQEMLRHGFPEAFFQHMKPWAVVALLSSPKPETGMFLDMSLFVRAQKSGKPVVSLETVPDQLGFFDELTSAEQAALLEVTLDVAAEQEQTIELLTVAYVQGDLAELRAISDASMADLDTTLRKKITQGLVYERNSGMVDQIKQLSGDMPVFIAVGALHMPGNRGILQKLLEAGYQVTRIY